MRPIAVLPLVLVLAGVAFAQINVGGPVQTQDPAYPLRVRILTRNMSGGQSGLRTWGRADLFGGAVPEQGFEYESTCDEVLMVTHGDERYSAALPRAADIAIHSVDTPHVPRASSLVLSACTPCRPGRAPPRVLA